MSRRTSKQRRAARTRRRSQQFIRMWWVLTEAWDSGEVPHGADSVMSGSPREFVGWRMREEDPWTPCRASVARELNP